MKIDLYWLFVVVVVCLVFEKSDIKKEKKTFLIIVNIKYKRRVRDKVLRGGRERGRDKNNYVNKIQVRKGYYDDDDNNKIPLLFF